jgi:ATP-binding cassette subfamily B multidrug efflux pump
MRGMMGGMGRAEDVRGTMRRLWGYLSRQKWLLIGIIALVALSSGLSLLGPYLMGIAIDVYILEGDVPGLIRTALLMIGAYGAASFAMWLQGYVMASLAQSTVRDIRDDLFAKLQTLSLRFFDQHTHGELMSRLTNDVENISNVLNMGATQFISSIFSVVGVVVAMLLINWRMALVTLITIPLMFFLSGAVATQTRRGFREQQETLGKLNGII